MNDHNALEEGNADPEEEALFSLLFLKASQNVSMIKDLITVFLVVFGLETLASLVLWDVVGLLGTEPVLCVVFVEDEPPKDQRRSRKREKEKSESHICRLW